MYCFVTCLKALYTIVSNYLFIHILIHMLVFVDTGRQHYAQADKQTTHPQIITWAT